MSVIWNSGDFFEVRSVFLRFEKSTTRNNQFQSKLIGAYKSLSRNQTIIFSSILSFH